jgi:hypothetical protein
VGLGVLCADVRLTVWCVWCACSVEWGQARGPRDSRGGKNKAGGETKLHVEVVDRFSIVGC